MFSRSTRWIALPLSLSTTAGAAAQFCEPPVANLIDVPWGAGDVTVEGDLLFVTHYNGPTDTMSLLIYTLAPPGSPTNPRHLASLDLGTTYGWRGEVKVRGNLALVTVGSNLGTVAWFIDISNPLLPTVVKAFDSGPSGILASIQDAAVGHGVAIVVLNTLDAQVFDLSDPANPMLVGHISLPWLGLGATIDGRVAYLSTKPRGGLGTLLSYDLTDPANPVLLDELTGLPVNIYFAPSSPLTIEGNRLYAVSGDEIRVVDISDPANMVLLETMTVGATSQMREVEVVGNVAYVAAGIQLVVLDLNGLPSNPPVLGSVAVIMDNIAFYGGFAYSGYSMAGRNDEVQIIDLSACPSPPLITSQPLSASAAAGGAPVVFGVGAAFADAYQWRFNGVPITDGSHYTGTTTATLTVQPSAATEGTYDVVVTNPQGSVPSNPAALAVTENADLNGDGVVDLLDYALFTTQFGGPFPP